jgi:hypothetical protein
MRDIRHKINAYQDVLLLLPVNVPRRPVGRGAVQARVDAPEEEERVREAGVEAGGPVLEAVDEARLIAAEDQGLERKVEQEEVWGKPPEVRAAPPAAAGGADDGWQDFVDAD